MALCCWSDAASRGKDEGGELHVLSQEAAPSLHLRCFSFSAAMMADWTVPPLSRRAVVCGSMTLTSVMRKTPEPCRHGCTERGTL